MVAHKRHSFKGQTYTIIDSAYFFVPLKETFWKLKECSSELEGMAEVTTFALGFKLGLRLMAEAFITRNGDQDLIAE